MISKAHEVSSSLTLSHRGVNDCKGTRGEAKLEFFVFFGFGITITGKRTWWKCVQRPTELIFFFLGHVSVQQS